MRFLYALILFFLLRVFFVIYNYNQLGHSELANWIGVWFGGIIYDWIFVWYAFIPIYLISWIESYYPDNSIVKNLGRSYFVIILLLATILSFIDTFYFPFSKVRSGAEILSLTGDNNISLFAYIIDYWWAIAILLFIPYLLFKSYPFIEIKSKSFKNSLVFFMFIPLGILMARGGFRLKPLHISDAIQFSPEGPWQVALNPGLVFAQTWLDGENELFPYDLKSTNSNNHDIITFKRSSRKLNVCIIILESFGIEYTQFNKANKPSYTPFLDSLAERAMFFDRFYANGLKSMDAVPAIYASVPALLNKPFITTSYSSIKLTGLNHCLGQLGYHSAFFHGADKNSMGFRSFLLKSGLEKYYSKEDFNGDNAAYDGKWGIYDEQFLQFAASKMDKMPNPFIAGIFTLSSHHPYSIPKKLKNKFLKGTSPIHESIQYADYALRKFFEEVQRKEWFNNTLFIITADHSSLNESPEYQNPAGRYQIPLLLFCPAIQLNGINHKTGQQIDLMPTVLDLIGYPYPFISLGRSLFDTSFKGSAIQYFQGNYTYLKNNNFIQANQHSISRMNNLTTDPKAEINLYPTHRKEAEMMYEDLNSFIGNFQYRIKQKQMSFE